MTRRVPSTFRSCWTEAQPSRPAPPRRRAPGSRCSTRTRGSAPARRAPPAAGTWSAPARIEVVDVQLVQVDAVRAEPPQRRLARPPDLLGRARRGRRAPVPSSNVLPNLVAMTASSRSAPSARARTFSLCPVPYTLAVSKNVTPSSSARRIARSTRRRRPRPSRTARPGPNGPPIAQQPMPSALTVMSERPSVRCMPRV